MDDKQLTTLVDKIAEASEYGGLDTSTMYGEFALEVAKAVRAEVYGRVADDIERSIAANTAKLADAVAKERERCAKLCQAQRRDGEYQYNNGCEDAAGAIRGA